MKKLILFLFVIVVFSAVAKEKTKPVVSSAPSCFMDHGKKICCVITLAGAVCAEQ